MGESSDTTEEVRVRLWQEPGGPRAWPTLDRLGQDIKDKKYLPTQKLVGLF